MADPLTQPLPVIPGMKIFSHKVVIDEPLQMMLANEIDAKAYVRSEFAYAAAANISEELIIMQEETLLIHNVSGAMVTTEYGLITDVKAYRRTLQTILRDYYMEGYTKAVAEFAAKGKTK